MRVNDGKEDGDEMRRDETRRDVFRGGLRCLSRGGAPSAGTATSCAHLGLDSILRSGVAGIGES